MRILHTADWHLGKLFYGGYLTEDQAYVLLGQLLPLIREEGIEAVVLAGDVYDRSLPPAEAVELFDEVATKITVELGVPFFVISGNHDSAVRLSFGSRLLERAGLHIYGELDKLEGPAILHDAYGPLAIVPLPFAEPAVVRHTFQDEAVVDQETALQRLIQAQCQHLPKECRTLCMAHAFIAGGKASESERPLSIGGTEVVSARLFKDFTYTALGHLHGPQQAGDPTIRYAGSILKYSFGEWSQRKGAVIVDIGKDGAVTTTFQPLTPKRDVRIISGLFADIMENEDDHPDDFVLVRLQDREPILDGMAKIRQKYPHALALETPNRQYAAQTERSIQVQGVSEQGMFAQFTAAMRPQQPLSTAEQDCMDALWKELLHDEGGGLL